MSSRLSDTVFPKQCVRPGTRPGRPGSPGTPARGSAFMITKSTPLLQVRSEVEPLPGLTPDACRRSLSSKHHRSHARNPVRLTGPVAMIIGSSGLEGSIPGEFVVEQSSTVASTSPCRDAAPHSVSAQSPPGESPDRSASLGQHNRESGCSRRRRQLPLRFDE